MSTENLSSIVHEWTVTGLQVLDNFNGHTDVIIGVLYQLSTHDLFGGIKGVAGSFPVNPVTQGVFTPFAELTEEMCISWMPVSMKTHIEITNAHRALNLIRNNEIELPAIA